MKDHLSIHKYRHYSNCNYIVRVLKQIQNLFMSIPTTRTPHQRRRLGSANKKKTSLLVALRLFVVLVILSYPLAIFYAFRMRTPFIHTNTITNAIETRGQPPKDEDNYLPRILAFVFPQFHQDPLNDLLWGEGFTDWNNLNKAPAKNRLSYFIPRPTELGFYDLSHPEPRKKQGELAKEYGIDGFVYHHYWFYDADHPGPNLHAPLVNMLKDGHPDVPFALHWCAMKWTNTWSGNVGPDFVFKEPGVLQKQYFPKQKDDPLITEHYNWLRQFFHHPNYIKVDRKPVFMLYQRKPGAMVVLRRLKELAMEDGFPGLYVTVGLSKGHGHLLSVEDI